MKLLSSTTLLLTSLFTTTLARLSIEFEPLPYNVAAGASYDVKWTANQDFVSLPQNKNKTELQQRQFQKKPLTTTEKSANHPQIINDFFLVHQPPNVDNGWNPVRKVTTNFVNTTAGPQSTTWKVPALKDDG